MLVKVYKGGIVQKFGLYHQKFKPSVRQSVTMKFRDELPFYTTPLLYKKILVVAHGILCFALNNTTELKRGCEGAPYGNFIINFSFSTSLNF